MNSGDFDSPFHDSEVEALEQSIRDHPAKGFRVPLWTTTCPGCGRGVRQAMLEVPHFAPQSKPLCSSCRTAYARWHRTPQQRAAAAEAREKRRKLGVVPKIGFPVE